MNETKIMGIGCFAKTRTLSRVLKKALERYILGDLSHGCPQVRPHSLAADGSDLLKEFIAGIISGQRIVGAEMINRLEDKKITGFFLAMENRCLNLSVFARGKSPVLEKYTTRLEELSRLRETRLQ